MERSDEESTLQSVSETGSAEALAASGIEAGVKSRRETAGKLERGEPILILHVEDDPSHAELIRRGFAGHRLANEIRHVENGQAALDYLLHQGDYSDPESNPRPDIILLDLRLPGIDGLEVLEQIRSTPDLEPLPVVILSTSEAERDKLESYKHRIDGYIVKPLDFDSFAILLDVVYLVLKR